MPASPPHHLPATASNARSEQDEYLGNVGPLIRAEVGDTIEVVFKNSLRFPGALPLLGDRGAAGFGRALGPSS